MYVFKENIPIEEFENFISRFPFAPIQQTRAWSGVKKEWQSFYCGVYKDGTIVGAALILVRKILPFFSLAYCPRGPVTDFTDSEAVKAFKDGAENFCKKRGIYVFTADPPIVVEKTLPDLPQEAFYDPFDTDEGKRCFENMTEAGFLHCGFGKELHSSLQPRYNAMIPLKDAEKTPLSFDLLKKNFKTKIRKYYANFQPIRGLYYTKAEPTAENISLFKKVLGNTEKRQKISLRGEEYFSLMAENFGDDIFFGFEMCRVGTYIKNLKKRLEKEPENAEKIKEQLSDAEKTAAERGEEVPLAALLTVYPPNKEGARVAEYLYAGSDLTVFPSFCATLCGLGDQCRICIEQNIDFLNLGGLAGTFDDGLYDFKKQFSPIIVEYAGEFEIRVKKVRYAFMKKVMPALQKIYKNAVKLFRKKR